MLVVRPYADADMDFVRRLFSMYTLEEKQRVPDLHLPAEREEEYLRWLVTRTLEGGIFLVAEVDGVRAGYSAGVLKKENDSWDETTRKASLVMELHVDPAFRRQGVGRRLVKELEDHFRSQDIEWITLGVFSKNVEARAFYEQIGFRDVYTFMGKRLENGPRLPGEPPPYGRPRARP